MVVFNKFNLVQEIATITWAVTFLNFFWLSLRKNTPEIFKYKSVNILGICMIYFSWEFMEALTSPILAPLYLAAEEWRIHWFDWPRESIYTFVASILIADLAYYWWHRFGHTNRFFWFNHQVHHQDTTLTMLTARRFGFLGPVMVLPVLLAFILLGVPFLVIVPSFIIVVGVGVFYHSSFPRLPRFLEVVLNTPANHRLHHTLGPKAGQCNYGGVTMIWDHIFRSYKVGPEPIAFGVENVGNDFRPATHQLTGLFGRFNSHENQNANAQNISTVTAVAILLVCSALILPQCSPRFIGEAALSFFFLILSAEFFPVKTGWRAVIWSAWFGIFTFNIFASIECLRDSNVIGITSILPQFFVALLTALVLIKDRGFKV